MKVDILNIVMTALIAAIGSAISAVIKVPSGRAMSMGISEESVCVLV
ncbi:MAG TPA: hypothetical protein VNO35_22645 [Steroidobacteraceae bacterium]|nr:hypothetical protein [Steroidobacteraceae bacterium]